MSVIPSDEANVPFEVALDKAGFGLYSYIYIALSGTIVVAFAFIAYSSSIIVPTSACELSTTGSQQGILASAPVIALMIGASFWGYLADTRGRKKMLMVSMVSAGLVNCLASISVNWVMLLILQFIATVLASGQFTMSVTLLSESVPIAKRNLVVLIVTSMSLLAQGIMAVLAIPIIPLSFSHHLPNLGIHWNSWRTLMVIFSIPSFLTTVWLFFMQESPKFVLVKGNEEEALNILTKIYRINNRNSKENFQVKSLLREVQKGYKFAVKDQIVPLFKAPLLKFTIIMTILHIIQVVGAVIIWLPTVANQFMKMLDTGASMDKTLCQVLTASLTATPDPDLVPCTLNVKAMLIVLGVGAIQSVMNLLMSTVVNKLGRRNIVMAVAAFCGLSGILINLVPNTIASAILYIILLIGFIVIGLYTAITVALFPTHLRALAVALTLTGGRIGTFSAIQLLNYLLARNCDAGFYIFSSVFISSAFVAFFLPDDRLLTKQPITHKVL